MKLRKTLLYVAAGSLALAALFGIAALLGASNWWAERAVATTLTVAYFSVSALACAFVFEQRRVRPLAIMGITIALLCMIWAVTYFWVDYQFWRRFGIRDEIELLILSFYLGMFVAHVCLLWLPRKPRKLVRAFQWIATVSATYCLGVMIDILLDVTSIREEFHERVGGSMGILTGLTTLLIPIWLRITSLHQKEASGFDRVKVHLQCPRCMEMQDLKVGGASCAKCGLRMTIDVDEPRCQSCGYLLYDIPSEKCPECGTDIPDALRWAGARAHAQSPTAQPSEPATEPDPGE